MRHSLIQISFYAILVFLGACMQSNLKEINKYLWDSAIGITIFLSSFVIITAGGLYYIHRKEKKDPDLVLLNLLIRQFRTHVVFTDQELKIIHNYIFNESAAPWDFFDYDLMELFNDMKEVVHLKNFKNITELDHHMNARAVRLKNRLLFEIKPKHGK